MDKISQQTDRAPAKSSIVGYAVKALVVALFAGLASGALMARLAPEDKFSLAGLLLVPIWLLLEIYFEFVIGVVGDRSKKVKIVAIAALLIGFYSAWFSLRVAA